VFIWSSQPWVLVDVITNPYISPFLSMALVRGYPIVDGVEMLV